MARDKLKSSGISLSEICGERLEHFLAEYVRLVRALCVQCCVLRVPGHGARPANDSSAIYLAHVQRLDCLMPSFRVQHFLRAAFAEGSSPEPESLKEWMTVRSHALTP